MRYDYIIVGTGSAGGALAGRLAERTTQSVLLLEASPEFERMPCTPVALRGTTLARNTGQRRCVAVIRGYPKPLLK